MTSTVGIVYSNELDKQICTSPKYGNRFKLVIGLTYAYKLTNYLVRIPPMEKNSLLNSGQLLSFHRFVYIYIYALSSECLFL